MSEVYAYFLGLVLGLLLGWWTTPKTTKWRLVYLGATVAVGVIGHLIGPF